MTEIEKYFIEGAVAVMLPVLAFFWGRKALNNKKEEVAIIRDVSLLRRSDDVLRFERGSYVVA